MSYRLGVDVGGTFTDVLLVEEGSGATWRAKTAPTPPDQAVGVLNGIEQARAAAGRAGEHRRGRRADRQRRVGGARARRGRRPQPARRLAARQVDALAVSLV